MMPRITGTGWAVPEKIRYNNDPVFSWLRKNSGGQDMFKGYEERRVLQRGQTLMDIMVPAAKMALRKAGKKAADVDLLIGTASVSRFIEPNDLSQLHKELGLPLKTWVIPVGNDFSNFASSLLIADGLLRAGRAKTILICLGCNWSGNVDYHTPQAASAADGAGAAVMALSADESKWRVMDNCTVTDTSFYGTMYTKGDKLKASPALKGYTEVYSPHFFHITKEGAEGFKKFGAKRSLDAVTQLLAQNNLTGADISFMPHQASSVLIDYWCSHLSPPPAQVVSTIKTFANATVATHALNLGWYEAHRKIKKNNLVLMSLGPDMHSNAMLLKRH